MGEENEILKKLQRIEQVEEDSNKILHKLYRALQWSRVAKLLYLLLILSIIFGMYIYIQPYIGDFVELYTGAQGALDTMRSTIQ